MARLSGDPSVAERWQRRLERTGEGVVPELARQTVTAAASSGASRRAAGGEPTLSSLVSVSPVAGDAVMSLSPGFTGKVTDAQDRRGRLVVVWTDDSEKVWGAAEGDLAAEGASSSVSVPDGHLEPGRGYRFAVFAKDASGAVGGRAVEAGYRTNSPPRAARVDVTPTSGAVSNARPVLSADVRDRDGAQLLEVEFTVTGAGESFTVPGRCAGSSRCVGSGRATAAVPAGRLVDGERYDWSVRVRDAAGWSAATAGEAFTVDATIAAPTITASVFQDQTWTVTPPASNTFTFSAAGAQFFSVSVDGWWPVTVEADGSGVGTWSWAPVSGWHTLSVTATDAVNNTSPESRFEFGVGSAPAIVAPANQARSATGFDVVAHGPASATAGQVSWRPARGGSWTVLDPVAVTQPAPGFTRLSTRLDVAALEPQLIRLRVSFTPGNPTAPADGRWLSVTDTAFAVADTATTDLGPGSVALPTGELAVSASDASDSPLGMPASLSRVWRSGAASATPAGDWAGFGRGWAAALDMGGASTAHVLDHSVLADGPDAALRTGWIGLLYPDGGLEMFTRAAGANGEYLPVGQDRLAGSRLVRSGSGDASVIEVFDAGGTITRFSRAGGSWTVVSVAAPGRRKTVRMTETRGTVTYTWLVSGISTAGGQCAELTLAAAKSDRGCRMLSAARDSASSNRITSAVLRTYDPAPNAIVERSVSAYSYDGSNRLTAQWDPLVGPQLLKTRYGYDASHRLISETPASADTSTGPALTPVTIGYQADGRARSAARARPDGSGDAVTRIVHGVAASGNPQLPDLSVEQVRRWEGMTAAVTVAGAAVFGPDHPIGDQPTDSDWNWASLSYWDGYGRETHTAVWGASQWLIDSTQYDATLWHPGATLAAGNRAAALAPECTLAVVVCAEPDSARRAGLLQDVEVRSAADPALVTWTLGPAVDTTTEDGTLVSSRAWVGLSYDQDAPNAGIAPDTGLPYRLTTSTTTATFDLGEVTDPATMQRSAVSGGLVDTELSLTGYNGASNDGSGWRLRAPTSTTTFTDDGDSPSDPDAITGYTVYDDAGSAAVTIPPGADLADAATTVSSSYGPWSAKSECRVKYWWAGLPCIVEQVNPPSGGSGQKITTTTTGFSWLLAETTTATTAGTAVAASTTTYDAAGRITSTTQTETGTGPGNWADPTPVPDTSYSYDPATGLAITVVTAAAGEQPAQTVTTGYDAWGRQTSYTDATGVTATTTYDAAGRVHTEDTGAGLTTWAYDTDTDHRGLPSATTTTGLPGDLQEQLGEPTVRTTWDANGTPTTMGITGIVSTAKVNAVGDPVSLTHTQPSPDGDTVVAGFTQEVDVSGRTMTTTSSTGQQTQALGEADPSTRRVYHYDNSHRLVSYDTLGSDVVGGGADICTIRDYDLTKDATRPTTIITTGTSTTGGACNPEDTTVTTTTRTFNSYGQPLSTTVDTTGAAGAGSGSTAATEVSGDYVYDQLGRVIVTPAADSASGTRLVTGYYTDDTVKGTATAIVDPDGTETGWTTRTYNRDPLGRTNTWTDGTLPGDTARQTAQQLQALTLQTDDQPAYTRHYSSDTDSPTWAENEAGGIDVWLPAPDGSIAANLSTTDPAGAGAVTLTDLHGDATASVPISGNSGATRATTAGQISFESFDAFGAPTADATALGVAPTTSDSAHSGGSSYGYMYNAQRSRQHTSGLILMGARLYNPITGLFTTPDPIPGGNPNPYTYPPDPVNEDDPSGLAVEKCYRGREKEYCFKLTKAEEELWNRMNNVEKAAWGRISEAAISTAVGMYRQERLQNAARHLIWQQLMSIFFGPATARAWGKAHEYGSTRKADTAADLRNNAIARRLVRGKSSKLVNVFNASFWGFVDRAAASAHDMIRGGVAWCPRSFRRGGPYRCSLKAIG